MEYINTYTLPEWAVCALEYDDFSGLTEDDAELIARFQTELEKDFPDGFEIKWGENVGFCRDHDLGGLAADCVEAHIYGDVARRFTDPTRAEMLRELTRAYRWTREGQNDNGWKFDVEEAVYHFASQYHGGQWSNLYSALCASPYRPGPYDRGLEVGSTSFNMMLHLLNTFCPKIEEGADE
jgi:hypothetical protein